MAGITHSAFRRLVSDFGGYGALCTEMLSAGAIVSENTASSPFTKKRESEGKVIYQLKLTGNENIKRVIDRIGGLSPAAIDINLGCPAPEIARRGGGIGLFLDYPRMEKVVSTVRKLWRGPLLLKCRLGEDIPGWKDNFKERMLFFENTGIDAVTVHPRFKKEKLKKRARWELFDWICSLTEIPIIANGDILSICDIKQNGQFKNVSGFMIGRISVVKPWIFRELSGNCTVVNYREVWLRFFDYVCDDFPPEKAIGRIKEFTAYFARNFFFGHQLYSAVQGASSLDELKERGDSFLSSHPQISKNPSVSGI